MNSLALALLTSSFLSIAAVHVCARPLRRWAGPRAAYACWLLPWLGVVAAALPSGGLAPGLPDPSTAPGMLAARLSGLVAALVAGPACRPILLVWAATAIGFLAVQLATYRAFVRSSARGAVEREPVGAVRVFSGPHVAAPLAAGILHPRIFLPADFDTAFSPDEQRMILRHERAHHGRRDIAANLAGLLLLSLHWWNPVAWRAHRRFRADQELACDAAALAGLGRADRHAYATAIIKCLTRSCASPAAAMGGRADAVARLSAIASDRHSRARTLPAALAVGLPVGLVFLAVAATQAVSVSPLRMAAAPRALSAASFVPIVVPDADPCEDAWRPLAGAPSLARYQPVGQPQVRLIEARLETARTRSGASHAA